jgi:glycosyltransferase involved in cell wall biosynthesis
MAYPLVSVVIVSYNQAAFIREALDSVLAQDYPSLEIVVSDDCSGDETPTIISKYSQQHPDRIVAIIDGPHLGITGNCNRALRACHGKYVAFLGGDDLMLPGKISKQVEWLEADEERVLCGHDLEVFDSATGKTLSVLAAPKCYRSGRGAHKVILNPPCGSPAIMVRKKAILSYGFDERIAIASDRKFFIDVLAGGGIYGCIEGVYGRYRRHGENVTERRTYFQKRTYFDERLLIIALTEIEHPQLLSPCRYARARTFYRKGRWFESNDEIANACLHYRAASGLSFSRIAVFAMIRWLSLSIGGLRLR